MTYDLTAEVKAIGSLNIEGNVIPIEWFKHIRLANNKPDLISIFILSDIIYWYRPTTIRDEQSGRIVGYKKKFKSDLLQKGYKDLEEMFGLSRDQIRDSLQRLEKLGLVKRVFKNITSQGSSISNVMFIKIFPNKIAEISEKKSDIGINPNTCEETPEEVLGNIRRGIRKYPNTYTETTTNTTTENYLSILPKKKTKLSINLQHEGDEIVCEMLKIWNEVIEKKFGREIKTTVKRKLALKSRLKEFFTNDVNSWKEFCKNILKSKFLMGEVKDFRVSLDWILKEDNMLKVIEGTYHREGEVDNLNKHVAQETNPEIKTQEIIESIQNSKNPIIWKKIMIDVLHKVGIPTYNSWFKKNEFSYYKNGILEIKSFSKFGADYINQHFSDVLKKICIEKVQGFKELIIKY